MPDAYDAQNVFAKILRGDLPCVKVHEDADTLTFMDIMPRADGHVLVIPKMPCRNLFDIPDAALVAVTRRVMTMAGVVLRGMAADGVTVQQFNESAGGQVVFHYHVHILPRWNGVPLRPHTGAMEKPETLERHAMRLRAALRG